MPTNTVPVIDPAQLHRATRGNASLQVEVLSLFVAEVERLMRQIEDAPEAQKRGDRLRALARSARNVGAEQIVQEARAVEARITEDNPDLAALRTAVDSTLAYLRRTGV